MERLEIKGTEDTPSVLFDKQEGIFQMGGRSLPEDVNKFYNPVLAWLDAYAQNPNPSSAFEMRFEYFNTASAKVLLDFFMKLDAIASDKGVAITVDWYYDKNDDDMKEGGEEYADFLSIPFTIKEMDV